MHRLAGEILFVVAPVVLAAILLRLDPSCRRIRWRSLVIYVVVMSGLILASLEVVAYVATARIRPIEIAVILWFTITWRLAWAIWIRTVGRWGQRWVRWGRQRRHFGMSRPWWIRLRLIPVARGSLTLLVFFTVFLSVIATHRFKMDDGQDPMTTFTVPFESVRIPTSDGLTLAAWFVPQQGAERTVVVCHGAGANKGNFVWFLAPLVGHGYNVVFFDFRAHGGSDGRTTTYGIREQEDVLAVVDWLKRERPDQSRRIVGLGSSQGAMALAPAAAADSRIDAVILDSAFTSPHEVVMHHFGRVSVIGPALGYLLLAEVSLQTGTSFFTASAERAVASLGERPLLIIHGNDDIAMPASHSQRLYDAASGPREIWFGPGPHSNIVTTDPSDYEKHVMSFPDRYLGSARLPVRTRPAQSRPDA